MSNTNPLIEVLNKQVANWALLYVKLHNFHWNVKGEQFFTLHTKFEELYNEAALHLDELAERVLTLQGEPLATMRDYLNTASVKEATDDKTANNMVKQLVDDFTLMIEELLAGMNTAQEQNDETTADMLLAIHASLQKHAWMLRAYLG